MAQTREDRVCGWCGEGFSTFVKSEQKYCSRECAAAARHDPGHKRGMRRIRYTSAEDWKEQLHEASKKSPPPRRGKRVWLVCGVTSMYLGLDGLLGIIRYQLNHSPYDGNLYVLLGLGVRFVAVNESFDTLTAERGSDGCIVQLKNIINDAYSKDISRKTSSALAVKQKAGEFIGSWAAYGYRKCAENKHRIEPNPDTAPVVRDIFMWRLKGTSYNKIAKRLNDDGIITPSRYLYQIGLIKTEKYNQNQWDLQVIRSILNNPVYLGHMVQGRKKSGLCQGQKQQHTQKTDWVIVENTHEPLIDEDTFRAVQAMSEQASKSYKKNLGKHDHLGTTPNILRGLIFCADCGRPLVRYKSVTNKGTNRYYVYICPTHSTDITACPKKYIHETELKRVLLSALSHEIELCTDTQSQAQ